LALGGSRREWIPALTLALSSAAVIAALGRLLGRAALALGATLAVLLAAEAGVRLLSPQKVVMEDLLREDPVVGLRHVPGFRGRLGSNRYDTAIAINSEGYRDREYPPRGSAYRVLGLGDSFAFGYGVEEPDCYLARMEAMAAGRGVEVINAGHPSFGPDNEALLLEADGPRLRPDLVLLELFVGNDAWNAITGPHRTMVVDGVLRSRPGVLEQWYRPAQKGRALDRLPPAVPASQALPVPFARWTHRSHVYRFLSRRYASLRGGGSRAGPRPLTLLDDEAVFLRDEPPELAAGWEQLCTWLARMAAWCGAHQAKLAVLVVPTAEQVDQGRWAQARKRHGLRDEDVDLERPQRIVGECARKHGLAVIDLLPALRKASAERARLYYRSDPHWTARGHAVAAGEALAQLRAQGLMP
jgi:hypothetical protein